MCQVAETAVPRMIREAYSVGAKPSERIAFWNLNRGA